MHALSSIAFWLVQLLMLLVFAAAAAAFGALLKGSSVLRRVVRGATRDDSAILLKSPLIPVVSVIATPSDASLKARALVRKLIGLHYSEHEVVLVLDGPSPDEMQDWTEEFRLVPSNRPAVCGPSSGIGVAAVHAIYASRDPLHLVVVEKARGGEADALNAGVNAAAGAVLALFDPQSEFAPDALLRLIRPMLEDPETTAAVCGVAPAPPAEGWVGRFAALDSLRLWLTRCAAFPAWKMLLPVPGCTVLLRRDSVLEAGGFTAGPIEMVLRLYAWARATGKELSVGLVPAPAVSYLRPPLHSHQLRETIRRDQGEIARAFGHRREFPEAGWGLPAVLTTRLVAPAAETILYPLTLLSLILGWIPAGLAVLVLMATVGTGILLSMAAVVLRDMAQYRRSDPGQLTRLLLAAIPDNLGYRQVRNLWLMGAFFQGRRRFHPAPEKD